MSRVRAQRRADRERVAAEHRAARERHEQRAARRRSWAQAMRARLPRRTRWGTHQGLLARRRRAQNAVIVGLYLAVQVVVWLLSADPWVRGASALVGLLAMPVLVTLALDRRS